MRYKKNHEIRLAKALLIDHNGNNLGEKSIEEAIKISQDNDLSLVLVNENPPVCKIIDYNKFVYEQNKKEKQRHKIKHEDKIKEFRLRPNIDQHDLETKVRNIAELISKKYRIKIFFRLTQRQAHLKSKAIGIIKNIYFNIFNEELDTKDIICDKNNIYLNIFSTKHKVQQ